MFLFVLFVRNNVVTATTSTRAMGMRAGALLLSHFYRQPVVAKPFAPILAAK